jgi:hypothetical protein
MYKETVMNTMLKSEKPLFLAWSGFVSFYAENCFTNLRHCELRGTKQEAIQKVVYFGIASGCVLAMTIESGLIRRLSNSQI